MKIRFYELTDIGGEVFYCLGTKNLLEEADYYISDMDIYLMEIPSKILDSHIPVVNDSIPIFKVCDLVKATENISRELIDEAIRKLMFNVRKLELGQEITDFYMLDKIKLVFTGEITREDYYRYATDENYRHITKEEFDELIEKYI